MVAASRSFRIAAAWQQELQEAGGVHGLPSSDSSRREIATSYRNCSRISCQRSSAPAVAAKGKTLGSRGLQAAGEARCAAAADSTAAVWQRSTGSWQSSAPALAEGAKRAAEGRGGGKGCLAAEAAAVETVQQRHSLEFGSCINSKRASVCCEHQSSCCGSGSHTTPAAPAAMGSSSCRHGSNSSHRGSSCRKQKAAQDCPASAETAAAAAEAVWQW
mgnify:CR=1 FL=1